MLTHLSTRFRTSFLGVGMSASLAMAAALPALAQGNDVQRMVRVQSASLTEVVVTFSHPVSLEDTEGVDAFAIMDASQNLIATQRVVPQGRMVHLHTAPLAMGRVYRVLASTLVQGQLPGGSTIPLDPNQSPLLFTAVAAQGGASSTPARLSSIPRSSLAASQHSSTAPIPVSSARPTLLPATVLPGDRTGSGQLPHSGAGLSAALALGGGIFGFHWIRRRRVATVGF